MFHCGRSVSMLHPSPRTTLQLQAIRNGLKRSVFSVLKTAIILTVGRLYRLVTGRQLTQLPETWRVGSIGFTEAAVRSSGDWDSPISGGMSLEKGISAMLRNPNHHYTASVSLNVKESRLKSYIWSVVWISVAMGTAAMTASLLVTEKHVWFHHYLR